MKRLLLVTALLLSSCVQLPPSAPANALLVTIEMAPGDVHPLVSDSMRTYAKPKWNIPTHTRRTASAIARDHDLRVVDAWPLDTLGELCLVAYGPADALSEIEQDPRVTSVQLIRQFTAMSQSHYNDDRVDIQLGDKAESLARLHSWATGKGVRIGIVDSPIERHHPDLRHRVSREVLTIDRRPNDRDKVHGTAVAGIIGAEANNHVGVVGFAPDADLYSYAACRFDAESDETRCNSISMALAIEAAAKDQMDVINVSLAGPHDPLLARMLKVVAGRGAIVVAAENENRQHENFPADLDFVIAAGSPSSNTRPGKVIRVDDEHLSTTVGGGYRFFYGASMSAARVSALVALMRQHAPRLDVAQTRAYLADPEADCNELVSRSCMMSFALEGQPAGVGVMD